MKTGPNDPGGRPQAGCNVSSTFNFTVGALAIAAAALLGYWAWARWCR